MGNTAKFSLFLACMAFGTFWFCAAVYPATNGLPINPVNMGFAFFISVPGIAAYIAGFVATLTIK